VASPRGAFAFSPQARAGRSAVDWGRARSALATRSIDDGRMTIVAGYNWYLKRELKKMVQAWREQMGAALARGGEGLRVCGNAFWVGTRHRDGFLAYERDLDIALENQKILGLCTYPLAASSSTDVLEVTRSHQLTAVRRGGEWHYIEASRSPIVHSLTLREMEVLTWVARGKSAWEIGKILGISKRTVDEHARSAAHKLGAANRAEASAIAVSRRIIDLNSQKARAPALSS
jgi:DNA-binding CsgD family transcriptional regulator